MDNPFNNLRNLAIHVNLVPLLHARRAFLMRTIRAIVKFLNGLRSNLNFLPRLMYALGLFSARAGVDFVFRHVNYVGYDLYL